MKSYTIDILEAAAREVCAHQEAWNPELRGWVQQEKHLRQAFFQKHQSNHTLRHQVLELLDAQSTVECLKQELYFRLGVQMGIELGSLDGFPQK